MKQIVMKLLMITFFFSLVSTSLAQPPFGRGGPGGDFGPGGPREKRELVKEFDTNEDGWLNAGERKEARASLAATPARDQQRGRGPGGPMGGRNREPAKPGPQLRTEEVKPYSKESLYEPTVFRTLFFEFENEDWEKEMEDFHGTDVDVSAKLTVDGKTYENVGVRFRGASSYGSVPAGYKRSLNVSLDMAKPKQRLDGYKTLNLLNSNGDPSYMSTVLYSHIAKELISAPQANHVQVVINGESWGVFVNVQQFDKIFLEENFKSSKGSRWKVSGNPGADGGLRFLGDDVEEYQARFEIKSDDEPEAWKSLIELCRTLNETPVERLEQSLEPMLDIDAVLRFLALDVALVNSDGYWTRASDYSLFLDETGKFHIVPHDMNEAFLSGGGGPGGPGGPNRRGGPGGREGFGPRPEPATANGRSLNGQRSAGDLAQATRPRPENQNPDDGPRGFGPPEFGPPEFGPPEFGPPGGFGGRGGFGGPGGGPGHGGVDLDPLVSIDNPRMPLRSQLLAVPKLREKYLEYVKQIAEKSLDWQTLGSFVKQQMELIDETVKSDTRQLDSYEAFTRSTASEAAGEGAGRGMPLREFSNQRRKFLLDYQPKSESEPSGS